MKKIIMLLVFMMVSLATFAGEKEFDERGNLSSISRSEMNGAFYNATLHFISKGSLYFADFTKDKLYFYITDGEEAYLIPNSKITQVYWKYPVEISELNTLLGVECDYIISLLYELRDGNTYRPHTEYVVYENYIKALERGEDAKYIGVERTIAAK